VDVQQSFKRHLSGRVFNLFVRAILLKGYLDTQCGFKCFKSGVAKELFAAQKIDGFNFDVEVLYLAQKKGYKIKEVPVMWKQGLYSRVNLFTDSTRMVRELFIIQKLHK
jgi:dolichyl-phosphate beta-glucosyltransferase